MGSGLFGIPRNNFKIITASGSFTLPATRNYLCLLIGGGSGGSSGEGIAALTATFRHSMAAGSAGSIVLKSLALSAGVVYSVVIGSGSLGAVPPAGVTNATPIASLPGGTSSISDPTPTIMLEALGGPASVLLSLWGVGWIRHGMTGGGLGGGAGSYASLNANVLGGNATGVGAGGSGAAPMQGDGVVNSVDLAGNPGGNGADGICVLIW